ncbi:MAG: hypothetical protein BGO11_00770 [Solirubrobacterales bacterium 70-9]|nr:MAG: hypothetical protein BGO11_00770 [Solirubrobacterales bacterium 70-9]
MFEPATIDAFRRFKALWDPAGRMNPGKTVDPLPLDSNLKHGPATTSRALGDLAYALPEDGNSLGQALERCVGVGRCRSADAGSMCPSYRATGEERDSTRGRARVLAEMVRGEVVEDGWRSEEVRAALDLCLGCKGCLSDCPTHVDMAIYKSEFMYHHYAGRRRPRVDRTLSLLPWALRLGTRWPALANAATGDGPLGRLTRRLGGVTLERPTPRIAPRPFRRRGHRAVASSRTAPQSSAGGEVVLWADTFTNAYAPDDLEHAIEILERHGLRVTVPAAWACCGRTLYDSGRLDRARRELTRLVGILSPYVDAGMPVVVLEPSCLASFRIELPKLLADDPRAAALAAAAKSLSETLLAARDTSAPPIAATAAAVERIGPVALHPHCHGRAIGTHRADRRLLSALGFDATVIDSGCCGLAGSFGFKPGQKSVSDAIGREQWLPRLRRGGAGRRLVIDGFSCHLQAVQTDADLAAGALRLNDLWWMAMAASEEGDR